MTGIYVDSIKDKSDTKTLATLSSSAVTLDSSVVFPGPPSGADGGHIIQVKQTILTADTTIAQTPQNITVTITPSSTSNKILLFGNLTSVARRSGGSAEGNFSLKREKTGESSTLLYVVDGITPWNDGASNKRSVGSLGFNYLDSPSFASAISYHFELLCASGNVDINDEGGISSLIAMEVVG